MSLQERDLKFCTVPTQSQLVSIEECKSRNVPVIDRTQLRKAMKQVDRAKQDDDRALVRTSSVRSLKDSKSEQTSIDEVGSPLAQR